MAIPRNEILPGAVAWDSFYDKHVQAILEPQRRVPALETRIAKISARVFGLAHNRALRG